MRQASEQHRAMNVTERGRGPARAAARRARTCNDTHQPRRHRLATQDRRRIIRLRLKLLLDHGLHDGSLLAASSGESEAGRVWSMSDGGGSATRSAQRRRRQDAPPESASQRLTFGFLYLVAQPLDGTVGGSVRARGMARECGGARSSTGAPRTSWTNRANSRRWSGHRAWPRPWGPTHWHGSEQVSERNRRRRRGVDRGQRRNSAAPRPSEAAAAARRAEAGVGVGVGAGAGGRRGKRKPEMLDLEMLRRRRPSYKLQLLLLLTLLLLR